MAIAKALPEVISQIANAMPVIGTVKGVVEAAVGHDLATGRVLSKEERALGLLFGVAALVPGMGAARLAVREGKAAITEARVAEGIAAESKAITSEARGVEAAGQEAENAGRTIDTVVSDIRCSFSPDTPVATDQGEQPIGSLQVGDHVLAYDEKLGVTGAYTVTAVLINNDPATENLTIDDEQLETTPEHPFFTQEKGWVAAGELWQGAHIRKADGRYGLVQTFVVVHKQKAMYNLTVAQAHTFFVGQQQWLVHNHCGDPVKHAQQIQTTGGTYAADNYNVKTLKKGDVVWGGLPGQTAFYTNWQTIKTSGKDATKLAESLQIMPRTSYKPPVRTKFQAYKVTQDVDVAVGVALNNTQFGKGGGFQYVIEDFANVLQRIPTHVRYLTYTP
jgi:hypothetical protein